MSKAFTKEGDSPVETELPEPESSVPGGKNYITPRGAKRLQEELHDLVKRLRPEVTATVAWAASNGDRSENADYQYGKKKLREIDRRISFLHSRIRAFEIIDPLAQQHKGSKVAFGATVTIRDESDAIKTYSIVGIDEVDVSKGLISWASPLASALLRGSEGDVVEFAAPAGTREVEIIEVRYVALE